MLLYELTSVEIDDTASPDVAASQAKRQALNAKNNPERAAREQQQQIADKQKEVLATKDSPVKQIDLQILRLKQQIASLVQKKVMLQKQMR